MAVYKLTLATGEVLYKTNKRACERHPQMIALEKVYDRQIIDLLNNAEQASFLIGKICFLKKTVDNSYGQYHLWTRGTITGSGEDFFTVLAQDPIIPDKQELIKIPKTDVFITP